MASSNLNCYLKEEYHDATSTSSTSSSSSSSDFRGQKRPMGLDEDGSACNKTTHSDEEVCAKRPLGRRQFEDASDEAKSDQCNDKDVNYENPRHLHVFVPRQEASGSDRPRLDDLLCVCRHCGASSRPLILKQECEKHNKYCICFCWVRRKFIRKTIAICRKCGKKIYEGKLDC